MLSYDVAGSRLPPDRDLRPYVKAISPNHAYTEYDDGREQFIFRGGPQGALLHARVDPARQSPDYGRGERVLHESYLPGVTARDAARAAQSTADRINRDGHPYLVFGSNSNWANAENTEENLGRRIGDRQTPGWRPPWPLMAPAPTLIEPLIPLRRGLPAGRP